MEDGVGEALDRAVHVRGERAAGPAGVDDDLRRRQRARAGPLAQRGQAGDRLRAPRERGERARGQPQERRGHREADEQQRPGREERDRAPHDRGGQPLPEAAAARPRPARPASEQREQRRLQRRGGRERGERHHEARDPERADERDRHREQQREPDRDREPGDEHRSARRLHRPDDRVLDARLPLRLLAEAVHDEQRVVDREAEADELDEVRHEGDEREHVRERPDDAERRGDRARGDEKRHERGQREPEHEQEHGERGRERDRLAPAQVGGEHRVEVVLESRLSRHERRRPAGPVQRAPQRLRPRLRVLEVERGRDVAVEDPAAGVKWTLEVARRHRRGRRRQLAAQPRPERRVRRVPHAEDDGEDAVRALAEVALEDRPRLLRLAARHCERGREPARERDRGGGAGREHGEPGGEDEASASEDAASPARGHPQTVARGPAVPSVATPQTRSVASAVPAAPRGPDNGGMRRLLLWLAVAAALVAVPTAGAAIASPAVRLTIVHVLRGCHSWGTVDSQELGPTRAIVVKRGTRLQIRVNCVMDFTFTQTRGPRLALGDPVTHAGTARTIVFRKKGLYRLHAVSLQTSEEMGLQTLGPDNVLSLTVRVR